MRSWLLIIALSLVPTLAPAADYATRAKGIIANVTSKDTPQPDDQFFRTVGDSFVRGFAEDWEKLLAEQLPQPFVVNPKNKEDPTDIGTGDGESFKAATAAEKTRLQSLHQIRMVRQFMRMVVLKDLMANVTVQPGDVGSKPNVMLERMTNAANAEADKLGNPNNDPES